jgi:chemotaxis protein CheD
MARSLVTIGISECFLSADPGAVLATHALGSCIAVAIHDPEAGVAGLLHFMLPESAADPEKSREKPFMFGDTGIPAFFRSSYELGVQKKRVRVALIGGAQMLQSGSLFQIGKRNHQTARRLLWRAGLMVHHEDVGGTHPRTVHMNVGTGRIIVSHGGNERVLVPGTERRNANGSQYPDRG